jgi:hypothetical protein
MSLLSGAPPYTDLEIEQIARSISCGSAYWCWYSSREAQRVFRVPIFEKMTPMDRVKLAEQGAIILFGFIGPEHLLVPTELPTFREIKWMDHATAKKVLLRARELEWQSGISEIPSASELMTRIDSYEQARKESIPDLRRIASGVQ